MHSPPLQALIREIKDINVFLADIAADTHEVRPPSAQPNVYAHRTCGNCCTSSWSMCKLSNCLWKLHLMYQAS